MEHIIQFGVTVDDDAIKKRILEQASTSVVTEVKKELGVNGGYFSDNVVRRMVNSEVTALFNKHKDAIIAEAGKQLADKLVRTKAVKEAASKVIENVLQEGNNNGN